jgi:hypothetical protein
MKAGFFPYIVDERVAELTNWKKSISSPRLL